jgi:hypothetical protein
MVGAAARVKGRSGHFVSFRFSHDAGNAGAQLGKGFCAHSPKTMGFKGSLHPYDRPVVATLFYPALGVKKVLTSV